VLIVSNLSSIGMNTGIENHIAINAEAEPLWLTTLKRQVKALKFGAVQVIVHEAQVVQIETTERVRFEPTARDGSSKFKPGR